MRVGRPRHQKIKIVDAWRLRFLANFDPLPNRDRACHDFTM
jgi:hypothetical protein